MKASPQADVASLKAFIEREVASLRSDVRHGAAAGSTTVAAAAATAAEADAPPTPGGQCPCGQGDGAWHACVGAGEGHDPLGCVCATLPAIPVSAALLAPVRDDAGGITDFVIRAGNHVRSADWLVAPDQQVGRRFLEARPGAAATGLLPALADVLATGRSLDGLVVDYTEERHGRLKRVQLVHYAAACGDQVLTAWRPVRSQAELLTVDAQHLASMGWGRWDLLSGAVSWSEGLQRIFRRDPQLPWSLLELCDALVEADVVPFAEFIASVMAGEEPAWTRIRFLVLGEVRTVDLLGRPVTGTDGRPWALQIVARDLTPQMRSRRRLVEKQWETEQLRQQASAERHVASALREALLPTYSEGLAELGLVAAAAYLPAEPDAAVGGDWYKCRPLPDRRALIAIGDASGHGLDAVARMAQQRYAMAGLAHTGASAGDVTSWLNELVCSDPAAASTATVVVGHIGDDRVLRWTSAGHPAPLLLRGGHAFTLPVEHRGPLLGVLPGHAYETAEFPLMADDVLLLYTDGVVERRGQDIMQGITALTDQLTACGDRTPQQIVDRLTEEYGRSAHDDDACLLAVRVD
ncbi:PP2C family protein-serine/threonine phosphatase [Streptomyces sp. SP18CS02]|uniref:PP2C family protein-serine/threonine phosphatase n=1 Tax=Streptomyces sp. SP18CS02 TaxID=3002531 RepID=UPI002E791542|nr:PP2C family protein-serine/threonine phosphatase [Streptomyces sp. SP18CS02]MEE1753190.1 PP2C family protein-serine/threonine phosphatase [Streptomyces sp. SP18CS02]